MKFKKFIPVLVILFLTASFLVSCKKKIAETPGEERSTFTSIPVPVNTMRAKLSPLEYSLTTWGRVKSNREIHVEFLSSGQISQLFIENGEKVKKGQLLCKLSSDFQKLKVERAKSLLQERELAFESEALGFTSRGDTTSTNRALSNLKVSTGVIGAEISLKEAILEMKNTEIFAYQDGTISDLSLSAGGLVKAGQLLCNIYSETELIAECHILESDLDRVKSSSEISVSGLSDSNIKYAGKFMTINPKVDESNGLIEVKIKILSGSGLLPGMNVHVVFTVKSGNSINLPKQSVVIRSGRMVVFIVEGSKAKWKYVKTGKSNAKNVEILDGLNKNDVVIISNNLQLDNNSNVQVIDD